MASLFILIALCVLLGAGIIIPIESQTGCPLNEHVQIYNQPDWVTRCDLYCDYNFTDPNDCNKRCICNSFYGRDDENGKCVLLNKPSPEGCRCPLTEVYRFKTCDKYCNESLNNETTCNKTTGCKCVIGWKRNKNGTCVPPTDSVCRCPLDNEVPNTRSLITMSWSCEKYCNDSLHNCTKPCICASGYKRTDKGNCVKPENCT